jgi:hypothetical protein
VSLALFALVAAIWGVLLIPLARHGRVEPVAWAPRRDTPARLARGARPWTAGDPPADDPDPAAAAARALFARRRAARRRTAARRRRTLLVLAVTAAAGLRGWAALGGRWWIAPAVAGGLLVAYLATLSWMAWRRRPRPVRAVERAWRRRAAACWRTVRRRASAASPAPGRGPVAPTTE